MAPVRLVSEGPLRITKATVDAAWRRRGRGSRLVLRDQECRGLALVVGATSMAWVFTYKPRGIDPASGRRFATRTLTLGNPGTHSPGDARGAANRLKGQAAAGVDPAAERREAIRAASARRALTVDRLMEDYSAALPRRPKLRGAGIPSPLYVTYELAQLRAAVTAAEIGDKAVGEVTPADVRALLAAKAGGPSAARHRFGALSRFFDWCHDEWRLTVNPCTLIAKARRPRPTAARAHFLAPAEIARLWRAAAELEATAPVHRDFARFLMAVPCRRGEAARMDWAQLDLNVGVWSQPGKLTKNGDPHRLHLHALALGILRERHDAAGHPNEGTVFPSPRSGKPISTFSDIKVALDTAAGLAGWRWHDFRRSFATALGEAGVAEPVVDAVLNHRQAATRGGVLGVYQRATRWPEQRAAMEAWGAMLAAAVETCEREATSETLPLRRAASPPRCSSPNEAPRPSLCGTSIGRRR